MLCPTQEREAEFEAKQERIRREKEKEMARLRAMQERAQDHQAEQVSGVLTHNVLLCWLAHHLPRHRPSKAKAPPGCGGSPGALQVCTSTWTQVMSWCSADRGAGREA